MVDFENSANAVNSLEAVDVRKSPWLLLVFLLIGGLLGGILGEILRVMAPAGDNSDHFRHKLHPRNQSSPDD